MIAVPAAARSTTIDTLRVMALLGVVVVNAAGYASFPDTGYIVPPPRPADSALAAATQWLVMSLFEGKAYPLLAFLFGVSFAASLRARGDEGIVHRRRRMARLLGLGLLHGLLLYAGDVLTTYAVCGFLLLRWARMRTSRLVARLRWWVAFAALGVAAQVALGFALGSMAGFEPQTYANVAGWAPFVGLNASRYLSSVIGWPLILPQIVMLMLAGLIAGRLRLLTHRRWRQRAGRVAAVALPLGVLLNGALALAVLERGVGLDTPPNPWSALFGVVGPVLSAGVAAAIVSRPGALGGLAPAGRLTLSMYLGASVLMALTLSGAGLGWQLGSVGTFAYALGLYALLLAAAWTAARAGWRGALERWLSR